MELKVKAIPSRKREVFAGHWNDLYSPADDHSRLSWLKRETVVMLEVRKKSRGGIDSTKNEVTPDGEEPVEILIDDDVLYQAGDLTIPARPDSGIDMHQDTSGSGPKPYDERKDVITYKESQGEDDPI